MAKKPKKKKKSNAGRPTKMTDIIVNKLLDAFSLGCTDLEACCHADISKQTLYNYQEKHPEFVDRKERLKEKPVLQARATIAGSLKTDKELAKWFLERRMKREFSVAPVVGSPTDGSININVKIGDE